MSTPSSTDIAQPEPERDLRDRPLVRVAILAVVLALAAFAARACTGNGTEALTQQQAVDKARTVAVVKDAPYLVRFFNQGIPPRGTWMVSFYTGPVEDPTTAQNVLVDAATGDIVDDGR